MLSRPILNVVYIGRISSKVMNNFHMLHMLELNFHTEPVLFVVWPVHPTLF